MKNEHKDCAGVAQAHAVIEATRQMAIDANARLRAQLLAALGQTDDGRTSLSSYISRLVAQRDAMTAVARSNKRHAATLTAVVGAAYDFADHLDRGGDDASERSMHARRLREALDGAKPAATAWPAADHSEGNAVTQPDEYPYIHIEQWPDPDDQPAAALDLAQPLPVADGPEAHCATGSCRGEPVIVLGGDFRCARCAGVILARSGSRG